MNLKNADKKRLFCESELVFNILVEKAVVTKDVPVFTRSFVIAENAAINSIYLDDKIFLSDRQNFISGISITERKLVERLKNTSVPHEEKLIFLQLFNSFQSHILDAMLLENDAEFEGTTLIAIPKTGNPQIDDVLCPNWIEWMSGR